MRKRTKILGGLLLVAFAAATAMLLYFLSYGLSAQDEPTRLEHVLARAVRHYAVPADLRKRTNPLTVTPAVLAEARAHFADHCASCHGNDGRGQTELGRNMYPKAPDMTLPETQRLSDGELFAIIENGVRLTGMPAWGDPGPEDDAESWELVHFIRHLPEITPAELTVMEELNPKTREELREEEEMRRFLEGEEADPGRGGHEH